MVDCSLFGVRQLVSTLIEEYAILHIQHYQGAKPVGEKKFIEEGMRFLQMTNVFEKDAPQLKFPTVDRYAAKKPALALVKEFPQIRTKSWYKGVK